MWRLPTVRLRFDKKRNGDEHCVYGVRCGVFMGLGFLRATRFFLSYLHVVVVEKPEGIYYVIYYYDTRYAQTQIWEALGVELDPPTKRPFFYFLIPSKTKNVLVSQYLTCFLLFIIFFFMYVITREK